MEKLPNRIKEIFRNYTKMAKIINTVNQKQQNQTKLKYQKHQKANFNTSKCPKISIKADSV